MTATNTNRRPLTAAPTTTAALRLGLRYVTETGAKATRPAEATHCRYVYQWDTDRTTAAAAGRDANREWHAFGDPVPASLTGELAGFHAHDVYHFALLAETGWSAVLEILMAGANGGTFGGPGALAEEAVVMDVFAGRIHGANAAAKSAALLNSAGAKAAAKAAGRSPITAAQVRRAAKRGSAAMAALKVRMTAKGWAIVTIADLPADFRERSIAWRQRSAMLAALNLDEVIKANLREIVAWGPSAKAFAVRSPRCAAMLGTVAGIAAADLAKARGRAAGGAWGVDDLTLITRAQIAAKGMLREIGDNAGTSPTAMTAADAAYVSRFMVGGHIRNAHRFHIKASGFEGIRAACIVNGALMDDATFALASRMVALLNEAASAEGEPISFAEYVARAAA